jgi:hypothetical protein
MHDGGAWNSGVAKPGVMGVLIKTWLTWQTQQLVFW